MTDEDERDGYYVSVTPEDPALAKLRTWAEMAPKRHRMMKFKRIRWVIDPRSPWGGMRPARHWWEGWWPSIRRAIVTLLYLALVWLVCWAAMVPMVEAYR